MISLFEYGDWAETSDREALQDVLLQIWESRIYSEKVGDSDEICDKKYEPFVQFDGNRIRAKNYVGFIQTTDETIEIYPKVFRSKDNALQFKELILHHIFYWFRYCRRWRFPFSRASLDNIATTDFPELIINLIARQFLTAISDHPLTMYQEIEEATQTPRGAINFKRYIANSISHGNYHRIECDYEPFLYDNKINRAIKYCTRLLLNQTAFYENQRILQEIIFILDDVEDLPCTVNELEKITLNSFYEEYLLVIDSCKLILNQQLYSNGSYDLPQWCLLFPMEYIFEDFIAGFLDEWFSKEWLVEYQKSEKYLAETQTGTNVFRMQHDIFLTSRGDPKRKIIIDAKYKLRPANYKSDPKKGVSQNDLYQMLSYAIRRGCSDIVLIYPNISENLHSPDHFVINSGFEENIKINVSAIEIPFWSLENFGQLEARLKEAIRRNMFATE